MRGAALLAVVLAVLPATAAAAADDWILSSQSARALGGERFEVLLVSPDGAPLPDEVDLRIRSGATEVITRMQALAPAERNRRRYAGTMPAVTGAVTLELAAQRSNELGLVVARRDAFAGWSSREAEPPLSENDPMYFVVGLRDGASARFQLSFKYRLFDYGSGFGRERPWLAGLYFGYTQTSLWDLSSDSKAFRDTSYRPSLFWKWERTDERTWVDAARIGAEHESNGSDGPRSRSLNTIFVRPDWYFRSGEGRVEFTPRINAYFDKEENPDIANYRGYVDWRLRYDSGGNWIATTEARYGRSGSSLLVDLSRRTRDLKIGPVSGYLHAQYFNGYGEDILDYNLRRKAQLRLGVAIVP